MQDRVHLAQNATTIMQPCNMQPCNKLVTSLLQPYKVEATLLKPYKFAAILLQSRFFHMGILLPTLWHICRIMVQKAVNLLLGALVLQRLVLQHTVIFTIAQYLATIATNVIITLIQQIK